MRKLPFEEPHKEEGEQAAPALSPTIRLALTTALRRIELAAWRAEERLQRQEAPLLALTHMVDPFTPEQRAKLLALLGELRSEVARERGESAGGDAGGVRPALVRSGGAAPGSFARLRRAERDCGAPALARD